MAAPPQPLLVLSESEFKEALHEALREFLRPDVLSANPLLRSRLVVERAGAHASVSERVTALQAVLREAAEALRKAPRDVKLYRALQQTYFESALTQEEAAALLDLPFSTYRRHLKSGELRIVELLWRKEIGDLERQ
jgi:DNA-directed RNA polymerase specialized sigma24 family protein